MITSKFDATTETRIVLRRERELRQHYFEQIEGDGTPRKVSLNAEKMIIGRAEDAAIVVPCTRASRHHAVLMRVGTDFVVQDHDSFNGVFLNGVKIYSAILRDGDIIQIADCSFVYREG